MSLYSFPSLPAHPARPAHICTSPSMLPSFPSPFQGGTFSPFSQGIHFFFFPDWLSQICFFSCPQSFSCYFIPLTSCKYAWVFPIWRKSPDTGFLLHYSQRSWKSCPGFPFLMSLSFPNPLFPSLHQLFIECLPCTKHCARYWNMAEKKKTQIPALTELTF